MAMKDPNPTDKHVGSRVRMRRLMLDMSQEKLAEELGLTFQQVTADRALTPAASLLRASRRCCAPLCLPCSPTFKFSADVFRR
jgi:hypothetical protein